MAASYQVAYATASALKIPEGRLTYAADLFRLNHLLPSHQGRSIDLSWNEAVLIVFAGIVGPPLATAPAKIKKWLAVCDDKQTPLRTAFAHWLEHPGALTRLSVDLDNPAAVAVVETGGVPRVWNFGASEMNRTATITGEQLAAISRTIKAMPKLRAGRPPSHESLQ